MQAGRKTMSRTKHGLPGIYNVDPLALADEEGAALGIDTQGILYSHDHNWPNPIAVDPGAFDGGTTNARGDLGGTKDPLTLYTVTGEVKVKILAFCTVLLAGSTATLEVGTAVGTAGLIPLTTATDIDAEELWHDTTPDSSNELETVAPWNILVNGADIIETPKTANITSGNVVYLLAWLALSADGLVTAS